MTFNTFTTYINIRDIGAKIEREVGCEITKLEALLKYDRETLIETSFKVMSNTINKLCSMAKIINSTRLRIKPRLNKVHLVLYRDNLQIEYQLQNADRMWTDFAFMKDWSTTIFISGWLLNSEKPLNNDAVETMKKAYDTRGYNNFIVLDVSDLIDTLYTWSAFNTRKIGKVLGKVLAKLERTSYPIQDIHIIGHSLGAHIAGYAARSFHQRTGKLLQRVTGLDPAYLCFKDGEGLHGIQRGDAEFIDIIHTNNDVLGIGPPIGDADFYPNGAKASQPGCKNVICAHGRAYQFYAETVYTGNKMNFLSIKCNSLRELKAGYCKGRPIPMGVITSRFIKGSFFLKTGSSSPFGLALRGTKFITNDLF